MSEAAHQRIRLDLAYDGSEFHGWATQPGLRTVQGEIEAALEKIFQTPVPLTVAGRTDAGVHARHQVANADLPVNSMAGRDLGRLCDRVNGLIAASYSKHVRETRKDTSSLPAVEKGMSDLVIYQITAVADSFDARFAALERHYEYRIIGQRADRDPIARGNCWWVPYASLDISAMRQAGSNLVGTHDFLSFCKPREGATTIRSLTGFKVSEDGGQIVVELAADAFCHSMVRSIVGALVEVGRGGRPIEWIQNLLEEPSRSQNVPIAPARGLTLVHVDYPPEAEWEGRQAKSRQVRSAFETDECR